MSKRPKHVNQKLQDYIAANKNTATFSLHSSNYTDDDMEIVAAELETNQVCGLILRHEWVDILRDESLS